MQGTFRTSFSDAEHRSRFSGKHLIAMQGPFSGNESCTSSSDRGKIFRNKRIRERMEDLQKSLKQQSGQVQFFS